MKSRTVESRPGFSFATCTRTALAEAVRRAFARVTPDAQTGSASHRRLEFENLESRLLLSADLPHVAALALSAQHDAGATVAPAQTVDQPSAVQISAASPPRSSDPSAGQTIYLDINASDAALNATLRINQVDGTQMLQLLDNRSGDVIRQHVLDANINLTITGSELNDALLIDLDTASATEDVTVSFDGR